MQEEVKSGATAVGKYHSHSIPLDMEDIERDWDKPIVDAGIAAKASVIVRVGMLDLGAGTGSFPGHMHGRQGPHHGGRQSADDRCEHRAHLAA